MRRSLIVLALLTLPCAAARSAEVRDLYSAQAIVTGTVEPERTRGFRTALVDVFVKLTGDARLEVGTTLNPLLQDPHRFVEGFEYEDRMKGIPVHDEQGTRERPHYLRVRFKAAEIDTALARLGLSKWPADRPVLAVWLGIRTAVDSYVLAASGPNGYGQRLVIVETAARRGLPVLLPAGDRASVTFDDIAANDVSKLRRESPQADALLSGILSVTPDGYWDIAWRLTRQDRAHLWTMRRVSFDTALKDGLQTSALVLSGNAPF